MRRATAANFCPIDESLPSRAIDDAILSDLSGQCKASVHYVALQSSNLLTALVMGDNCALSNAVARKKGARLEKEEIVR